MTDVKRKRRRAAPAGIAPTEPERDILDQYLYEVSTYPLLKAAEEIELAKKIRAGDQDALQELVKRNLRFVISVAKKYQNRGLPLIDLIGEGNVGLLTAARKFDPDQGVKFISYAVWWIRQAILSSLARQGRTVRVPLNRTADLSRIIKASEILRQKLRREPSPEELAQVTGLSVDVVQSLAALNTGDVRLDAPMDPDGDRSLIERFVADEMPDTEEEAMNRFLTDEIEQALSTLPPRDAKVLRLYFGLEGGREHTLEEIGSMLGVTRERVRQLRDRALKRLREGDVGRALSSFAAYRREQRPGSCGGCQLSATSSQCERCGMPCAAHSSRAFRTSLTSNWPLTADKPAGPNSLPLNHLSPLPPPHHIRDVMIELKGVHKAFGRKQVLTGFSLVVPEGETMVIIGYSGTGKSVAIKHIVGLLEPDAGEVWVDGLRVDTLGRKELYALRRKIGYVFQFAALFDSMTIGENVAMGLRKQGELSEREILVRVDEALNLVDLPDVQNRMPAELSGGMRKRVGIARAIALRPKYILYDEPTTGLDPVTSATIDALMVRMREQLGVTGIVITHDMRSAYTVGTRIAMLYEGAVRAVGSVDEIKHSTDPLVRQFIEGRPTLEGSAPLVGT